MELKEIINEKLNELDTLEEGLPEKYNTLIERIDYYIFGAEKCYEKATELCIIVANYCSKAACEYNKELAFYQIEGEDRKISISGIKEYKKARSVDKQNRLLEMEYYKSMAEYRRGDCWERLQTFKKIKGGNTNIT